MEELTAISRVRAFSIAVLLTACVVLPYISHAQAASDDLQAAIKAALLSDPRTSGLSQLEVEGIVGILADEAERRGITVEDLQWRPQNTEGSFSTGGANEAVSDTCGASLLCAFNEAFGFVGPDQTIPYILGVASMGLIWIVAEMRHRRRHPVSS
jgi:hypothetical protein